MIIIITKKYNYYKHKSNLMNNDLISFCRDAACHVPTKRRTVIASREVRTARQSSSTSPPALSKGEGAADARKTLYSNPKRSLFPSFGGVRGGVFWFASLSLAMTV